MVSVHQLLESSNCMSPTPQMMADLQSLACALLESLNDKNVALSHQRKTNKSVQLQIYLVIVLRVYKSKFISSEKMNISL